MRYSDFVLHFETSAAGDFVVRVLDSPAGEGYAKLGKDLSAGESVRILAALALGSQDGNEGSTEALGANLFSSLFCGQVRHLYEMSLGTIGRKGSEKVPPVSRETDRDLIEKQACTSFSEGETPTWPVLRWSGGEARWLRAVRLSTAPKRFHPFPEKLIEI